MKRVTLRESHENTATLVREAVRLAGLVVTDPGTPIARIEPANPSSAPIPPSSGNDELSRQARWYD